MRAVVTREFHGVEDGKVHPRLIKEGEVITGDLADTAVRAKDARKLKDGEEPPTAGSDGGKTEVEKTAATVTEIEITAGWKALKEADLIALGTKIKGSDVASAQEAAAVIDAEVSRRADVAAKTKK